MPEGFTQLPPDSTGKRLATQERTINAQQVHLQRVIDTVERVPTAKVWSTSLRIPNRALAAGGTQLLWTLWNGNTTAPLVGVRRLSLEVDSLLAQAVAAPTARLFRASAAGANGTVVANGQQDTAETGSAAVVVRADHAADGVSAATALSGGTVAGAALWSQITPRFHTMVGYAGLPVLNLLPDDPSMHRDDPLFVRGGQGLVVRLDASAAVAVNTFHYIVKCVWTEFTIP